MCSGPVSRKLYENANSILPSRLQYWVSHGLESFSGQRRAMQLSHEMVAGLLGKIWDLSGLQRRLLGMRRPLDVLEYSYPGAGVPHESTIGYSTSPPKVICFWRGWRKL